jgi:threonine aldolase
MIDVRSDTVTKPTAAMYDRMVRAAVGDDSLDGDPTVRELEVLAAEILGKRAGLFVPSCTKANLLATLAHAGQQEQVVLPSDVYVHLRTQSSGLNGCLLLPSTG